MNAATRGSPADRLQADGRPERESSGDERQADRALGLVQRRAEVLDLAAARVVAALRQPHAPEVEAQRSRTRTASGPATAR